MTGGAKGVDAMEGALELGPDALQRSRRMLARTGNVSSTSILLGLNDLLTSGTAKPGEYGMLIVVGPGFCSQLVLLRWDSNSSRVRLSSRVVKMSRDIVARGGGTGVA